jgi:hypothetical protein
MQTKEQTPIDSLAARWPRLVFLKKESSGLEKDSEALAKKGGVGLLL